MGRTSPKVALDVKAEKFPGGGAGRGLAEGTGLGLWFHQAFSLESLSGVTGAVGLPRTGWVNECQEGLFGCVWAPALTMLGAGSRKPTRDTELAVSCAQNPAPEATLMQPLGCADQMCSSSELYSRETAKKSIRGALLMRVSFWKWRN